MKYIYKCKECGTLKTIEQSMKDPLPKNIPCEQCKVGYMNQDFKSKVATLKMHTPEDFKACSEYHSVDFGGTDEEMEKMLSV